MATNVTPFAGVWIEIVVRVISVGSYIVTPFAGVWIEIIIAPRTVKLWAVTPFAGVWIEILCKKLALDIVSGHSLCGSVD